MRVPRYTRVPKRMGKCISNSRPVLLCSTLTVILISKQDKIKFQTCRCFIMSATILVRQGGLSKSRKEIHRLQFNFMGSLCLIFSCISLISLLRMFPDLVASAWIKGASLERRICSMTCRRLHPPVCNLEVGVRHEPFEPAAYVLQR